MSHMPPFHFIHLDNIDDSYIGKKLLFQFCLLFLSRPTLSIE